MAVQALLLAQGDDSRDWLQTCLGDDIVILPGDARTADESVAEVENMPDVTLVFVQFNHDTAAPAAIVESLAEAYPQLPVIAVGREDSGDRVLAAMRAGAEDFFVTGRDDARLATLLERVLSRKRSHSRAAPGPTGNSGHLISVTSSPQTPLLAFLAAHIAFVLESERDTDQRVLLLDLSLPGGNAAIMFDGSQEYTALDVLRDVERCDETLVESAFQRLDGGVYMLALPEDFVDCALADQVHDLDRLLEIFSRLFDYTVVCADSGLGTTALSALITRSTHALLLSDQSVLRSRQNKALIHELRGRGLDLSRLRLVIGNIRADVGIEPERLAELLGLPLAATLGGRLATRLAAMNAGESIFEYAPADEFGRSVKTLVEQLLGVVPGLGTRARGIRGWFGRRKR